MFRLPLALALLVAMPAAAQAPRSGTALPKPTPDPMITHPTPAPTDAAPGGTPAGADSPATAAYKQAMQKMMSAADAPYSGDPDRDFVAGMLPHHNAAVEMARIEMQYGHDPELKQLAHDIIVSQNKEIVFMRRWMIQHPQKN